MAKTRSKLKEFFIPTRGKIILFFILFIWLIFAVLVSYYKGLHNEYDIIYNLTIISVVILAAPFYIVGILLFSTEMTTISPVLGSFLGKLQFVLVIVYLYFLSCLLIVGWKYLDYLRNKKSSF